MVGGRQLFNLYIVCMSFLLWICLNVLDVAIKLATRSLSEPHRFLIILQCQSILMGSTASLEACAHGGRKLQTLLKLRPVLAHLIEMDRFFKH